MLIFSMFITFIYLQVFFIFIFQADNKDRMLSEQSREVERMKTKMQEKLASEKDRLRRIMVKILNCSIKKYC